MSKINLIVGNTSQLAPYFPDNYLGVSSRDIDYSQFKNVEFDRVIITFAEQRTYIMDNEKMFTDVNVDQTLEAIKFFAPHAKYVVVYGTCELWNNAEGPVNINTPFKYNYSPYRQSKEIMVSQIKALKLRNVIILHTFNFNSPYRKAGFLFSKIFDSLINKTTIEIGDTYFYRDLIHPEYVVSRSMKAYEDEMVGLGRLVFVNDFIRDLYASQDMEYEKYVKEDLTKSFTGPRNIFYADDRRPLYNYDNLLNATIDDIRRFKYKTG